MPRFRNSYGVTVSVSEDAAPHLSKEWQPVEEPKRRTTSKPKK